MSPRWHALATLALLGAGCDSTYPLPPTPCDDHCRATERAGCSSDDPAECVRDCESQEGSHVGDVCLEAWRAVDTCFLHAPGAAFFCDDDHSRVSDICLTERRALSECLAPGSGACFDECLRRDQVCGGKLSDCEEGCHHTSPACQTPSSTFYTCLRDQPEDCGGAAAADAGAPSDIPCFYEALGLLACGQ